MLVTTREPVPGSQTSGIRIFPLSSRSLFPCFPSPLCRRSRPSSRVVLTSTHLISLDPHPPPLAREASRALSSLTQAGRVKRGMSLALPLPAAVAGAQTLQQVALRVALAPRVANAVG